MTVPADADLATDPATDPATTLGRAVVGRLHLPGPPNGRLRPSRIGSLASASTRFAAATSRPVAVRRMLQGPAVVPVNSFRDVGVQPPRWWAPAAVLVGATAGAPDAPGRRAAARHVRLEALPQRSLPRAVRRVPNEQTWTPGGIVESLVSSVAPVRRLDAVTAAGAMLTQQDRVKLNAASMAARSAKRAARPAEPDGHRSYSGRQSPPPPPSLGRAATQRSAPATAPAGRPPGGGGAPTRPSPSAHPAPAARPSADLGTHRSARAAHPGTPAPAASTPIFRTQATGPMWRPARIARFARVRHAAAAEAVTADEPVLSLVSAGPYTLPPAPTAPTALAGPSAPTALPATTDAAHAPAQPDVHAPADRAPAGRARPGSTLATGLGLAASVSAGASLAAAGPAARPAPTPLRRAIGLTRPLRPSLRMADAAPHVVALPAAGQLTEHDTGQHSGHHQATGGTAIRRLRSVPAAPATPAAAASTPAPSGTAASASTPSGTASSTPAPSASASSPSAPSGTATSASAPSASASSASAPSASASSASAPSASASSASAPSGTAASAPAGAASSAAAAQSPDSRATAALPGAGGSGVIHRWPGGEPRGLDVASYRPLANAAQPRTELRPALSAHRLPAAAAGATAWLSAYPASAHSTPAQAAAAHATSAQAATANPGGSATELRRGAAGAASLAMAELLAIHRTPARGARPQRWGTLATGFGASEPIRPAGTGASGPVDARRAPGPNTLNTLNTASPPNTASPQGVRAYLPAPPPVSFGRGAPAVPAAAGDSSSGGRMAAGAAGPLSLVASTAAAFGQLEANARYSRLATHEQAGSQMTEILPPLSMSRTAESVAPADVTVIEVSMLDDAAQLNQLVDEVVDRIERRVVDELERRGRRYTPGAF